MMTYQQAREWTHSLLRFGSKPGLQRMEALMQYLRNPHQGQHYVHVAGTNGKGSTCTMLASIFRQAGYKTGLFLSPYVVDFRERIQIDGQYIPEETFAAYAEKLQRGHAQCAREGITATEFEVITALALDYFAAEYCDIVVLETGLGGLLDSTNIIEDALVSVLTKIGYDHMDVLGHTLREIALQKCGIIKPGGITVSYPQQPEEALTVILARTAAERNSLILPNLNAVQVHTSTLEGTRAAYDGLQLHIPLLGQHQVANAITAVEAAKAVVAKGFAIRPEHMIAGIAAARFPARFEVLHREPLIILDGAHNADGAKALSVMVETYLRGKRIIGLAGILQDKAYDQILAVVAPHCASFVTLMPDSPRALSAQALAQAARPYCADCVPAGTARDAIDMAIQKAGKDGCVLVFGSLYLATSLRQLLLYDAFENAKQESC